MKKLFLSLVLLTVGALAFSQQLRIVSVEPIPDYRIVSEEPIPDYQDLSGFSGYGWGTRWAFIVLSMEDENYELLYTATPRKDLWYRASINGEDLKIVYYFENGVLASGMWVIDDVDQPSFWVINEYLQDSYDSNVELTVKNDNWIKAEMFPPGTNSWIIHNLDVEENSHTVHYHYRRGAE